MEKPHFLEEVHQLIPGLSDAQFEELREIVSRYRADVAAEPEALAEEAAVREAFGRLGWAIGEALRLDEGDLRSFAVELVARVGGDAARIPELLVFWREEPETALFVNLEKLAKVFGLLGQLSQRACELLFIAGEVCGFEVKKLLDNRDFSENHPPPNPIEVLKGLEKAADLAYGARSGSGPRRKMPEYRLFWHLCKWYESHGLGTPTATKTNRFPQLCLLVCAEARCQFYERSRLLRDCGADPWARAASLRGRLAPIIREWKSRQQT
ncbi:MAG: hypothetical protein ACNA8S_15460 [Deferrisomatales bacterium]